jgi:hypothetical protein
VGLPGTLEHPELLPPAVLALGTGLADLMLPDGGMMGTFMGTPLPPAAAPAIDLTASTNIRPVRNAEADESPMGASANRPGISTEPGANSPTCGPSVASAELGAEMRGAGVAAQPSWVQELRRRGRQAVLSQLPAATLGEAVGLLAEVCLCPFAYCPRLGSETVHTAAGRPTARRNWPPKRSRRRRRCCGSRMPLRRSRTRNRRAPQSWKTMQGGCRRKSCSGGARGRRRATGRRRC